ncbi:MAG: hypothetical protein R2800_15005 [Flavipsychrobacter sp.]
MIKNERKEYREVDTTAQQVEQEVTGITFITPTQIPRAGCPQRTQERVANAVGVHHISSLLGYYKVEQNQKHERDNWVVYEYVQGSHLPMR